MAPMSLETLVEEIGFDPADPFADPPEPSQRTRDAAIEHLRQRYVEHPSDQPGEANAPVADGPMWDGAAARLLAHPEGRDRFVDEVLFDVWATGLYPSLLPVIRWLLPEDDLREAIAAALTSGRDAPTANALGLLATVYGRMDGPRLTATGEERIRGLVDDLRDGAAIGRRTAEALRGFVLPADPVNRG